MSIRRLIITGAILYAVSSCVTTDTVHQVELRSGDLVLKRIPDRSSSALTGSQFVSKLHGTDGNGREAAILKEAMAGNIPDFLRRFKPVKLTYQPPGKPVVNAVIWVMPDYLAIGSDKNFVRVPMNPVTAQKIADRFGCILPTTKIVDAIYAQAAVKLSPQPMKSGSDMISTNYFWRHNLTIESQLRRFGNGKLVAGHKKDVVLTNRLRSMPTRVAIYGWHMPSGNPIQPLSLVHGYKYADYSHGIRLVSNYMQIDGKAVMAPEILKDPSLAGILSNEGSITTPRIRTEMLSQAEQSDLKL